MASLVKRKKATASTTTSSKAPESTVNPASSIKPIWAPPKNSLNSSSKSPPPSRSPPPCETSASPAPCGWLQNSPACGRCWNPCGLLRVPDPAPLTISCSPPFTASVIPVRRPKSATGTRRPSSLPFPAERFTSQAFWDAFEQILPEQRETVAPAEDPLDHAQLRLLGLWKEKQLVGRRLLAYDTTNFYTYIASTNTRNQLAQRGHNKQGRHNL